MKKIVMLEDCQFMTGKGPVNGRSGETLEVDDKAAEMAVSIGVAEFETAVEAKPEKVSAKASRSSAGKGKGKTASPDDLPDPSVEDLEQSVSGSHESEVQEEAKG